MNKKTLNNNLSALDAVCPIVSDFIRNGADQDWIELIRSNDTDNLLIKSSKGKLPVYDINNPKKATKLIAKNLLLGRTDITTIIGCGLGYLTKAILDKMDKSHHLILIETVPQFLKYFLSRYNLAKKIEDGNLIICTDKDQIAYVLSLLESKVSVEQWSLLVEAYTANRPLEYREVTEYTSGIVNQIRCNTGTVMSAGARMALNDIENLPYVIRHRGVNELRSLFKDKPAVIVSTGPSLEKNIHYLKEHQDKVIIVAVAQSLRILLAYDIVPDFICTVDFGEVNMDHFKGILDCTVPLVCVNRTYSKILKAWQGSKFVITSPVPGYEDTAIGLLNDKGAIDQGGSVSHCCFSLAHFMGCSPITLIGQDLALSDGKSHIPQVDSGGTVKVENGMINWKIEDPGSTLKKKDTDTYSMGPAIHVPGYFGGVVVTNLGLLSFISAFENLAKVFSTDSKLFNSTTGGAYIQGFERITLLDYLENFCQNKLDKSITKPLLTLCPNADDLIGEAIVRLRKSIETIDSCFKEASSGLVANKRVEENIYSKDVEKLKKWIMDVEKPSLEACRLAYKDPLIKLAIFNASRKIETKEFNEKPGTYSYDYLVENRDELKMRCERNKIILEAAKEQSNDLLRSYRKALAVLEKYQITKDEKILLEQEIEEITLEDADKYFEVNNWTHPLIDARRVLLSDPEYTKNIISEIPYYPLRYKHSNETLQKAKYIARRAVDIRDESISNAKETYPEDTMRKQIKYINLIEESRKIGKEQLKEGKEVDVTKSESLIEEAYKLYPDKIEAKWGMATNLCFKQKYEESIKLYRELVEDFPDSTRLEFELGQTLLLSGNFVEGMKVIGSVMQKSKEYDSFLFRVGELYFKANMFEESLLAFENYLDTFKADYTAWEYKGKCLTQLGKEEAAALCFKYAQDTKKAKQASL